MLEWRWTESGHAAFATPLPAGCDAHVTTERDPDDQGRDIWRWSAGWINGHAGQSGYATEQQAQLSCEAAMLRLGILPLPRADIRTVIDHHPSLRMEDGPSLEYWRWSVVTDTELLCNGICLSESAAKTAAERHLRAELAAHLDALAVKEGGL